MFQNLFVLNKRDMITISHYFLIKIFSNEYNKKKICLKFRMIFFFHFLFSKWYKKSHVKLFKPHLITAVCTDMTMFDHLKTVWKLEHIPKERQFCRLDFAVSFAFRYYLYFIIANFPMPLSVHLKWINKFFQIISLFLQEQDSFVFCPAFFRWCNQTKC